MYSASYSSLHHCKSNSSDTSTSTTESLTPTAGKCDLDEANQTKADTTHCTHVTRRSKTIVIFDWDDTLYPTTAMRKGQSDLKSLSKLSLKIYQTLNKMIHLYGSQNVFIVSNAHKLWIDMCLSYLAQAYFVNIYHLIKLHDITIISAKEKFETQFPKQIAKWKRLTFEQIIGHNLNSLNQEQEWLSVVSIGDSIIEYNGSRKAVRHCKFKNKLKKRVVLHRMKLIENPSIVKLTEQFELIDNISYLFGDEESSIDIDYEKEMNYYVQQ